MLLQEMSFHAWVFMAKAIWVTCQILFLEWVKINFHVCSTDVIVEMTEQNMEVDVQSFYTAFWSKKDSWELSRDIFVWFFAISY